MVHRIVNVVINHNSQLDESAMEKCRVTILKQAQYNCVVCRSFFSKQSIGMIISIQGASINQVAVKGGGDFQKGHLLKIDKFSSIE